MLSDDAVTVFWNLGLFDVFFFFFCVCVCLCACVSVCLSVSVTAHVCMSGLHALLAAD